MSRKLLMLGAVLGTVCLTVPLMGMMATSVPDGVGPQFQSAGPLPFGAGGILFAAAIKGGPIFALALGDAGAGAIEVISLDRVGYTSVALPNPPKSDPSSNRDPGMLSITDMAYVEGRLFIAGLSNEEFAS